MSEGSLYEVFLVFWNVASRKEMKHPLPAARRPLYMVCVRQEPTISIPFLGLQCGACIKETEKTNGILGGMEDGFKNWDIPEKAW